MHKAHWQLEYERNKNLYWQRLNEDLFRDWERSRAPDSRIEIELGCALDLLYADQKDLAQQYLRRAIAVGKRALAEDKCRSEKCKSGYPRNEAQLLRSLAYARALVGEVLDQELLRQAAIGFEGSSQEGDWDPMAQIEFLAGIRMWLLAGDRDRAAKMLRTGLRRSLKDNHEEEELLERIARARPADDGQQLEKEFRGFFDKVRDPRYKPPSLPGEAFLRRFDLGALRDKYFVSGDGAIDWNRVADAVSE